ncbi:MAG: hydratase [Rhodobiaceae bacterium]|nr:hydratase [Rhodobiaceae bacterium]MCC0040764.1 hydratase [Rhodobiaceae bacterium]
MDGSVIDALPAGLRPETRAQGYAIQACLEGFSAKPLAGWKIAATSAAGQAHINVDGPIAGRLLAERLRDDGASVSIANNRMRVCEPEFAFRFAEDVPPRAAPYSVEEALARVGDLHLTIELPDSRFTDFCAVGAPSLIADDACAEVLIVGPRIDADWRALDLARYPVRAEVKGRYDREGSGANVLSDPRIALAWLVNEVTQMGITLRRGELVTTGTCMVPLEVEPGDVVSADFGALGRIGVRISDDG